MSGYRTKASLFAVELEKALAAVKERPKSLSIHPDVYRAIEEYLGIRSLPELPFGWVGGWMYYKDIHLTVEEMPPKPKEYTKAEYLEDLKNWK